MTTRTESDKLKLMIVKKANPTISLAHRGNACESKHESAPNLLLHHLSKREGGQKKEKKKQEKEEEETQNKDYKAARRERGESPRDQRVRTKRIKVMVRNSNKT